MHSHDRQTICDISVVITVVHETFHKPEKEAQDMVRESEKKAQEVVRERGREPKRWSTSLRTFKRWSVSLRRLIKMT